MVPIRPVPKYPVTPVFVEKNHRRKEWQEFETVLFSVSVMSPLREMSFHFVETPTTYVKLRKAHV